MAQLDPKQKLTEWLTKVNSDEEAGTRLMSKEQKSFYLGYYALAEALGIPFFKEVVQLDERLMMAYQGRRSDDVVAALRSVTDSGTKETGLQPAIDYLKKRQQGGGA